MQRKARTDAARRPPAMRDGSRPPAAPANLPQWRCSDEQRRAMVEQIAYSHAERRGFAPGHELQDWLDAEAEVDRWLEGEQYSGD